MLSRIAIALAILAGSASADLTVSKGTAIYVISGSHCYEYIIGTSFKQQTDTNTCSADTFVSDYSLGTIDTSTANQETFSDGDGTCYNGGGRAATVTYTVDNDLASTTVQTMYEPQTCYYVIALAGPELPPAGFCFSGSSTVTRLVKKDASDGPDHRASLEVEELPLTALSVGDQIQAMGHDGRKTWTTVTALPHSKSKGAFVDITTVGGTDRKLSATEHHTFPNCKAGSGLHLMVPAHALKAGDCVHTANGQEVIGKVETRPAAPSDVTYTVEVEGDTDLIVVGGVVTHARPEQKPAGSTTKTKKHLREAKKVMKKLEQERDANVIGQKSIAAIILHANKKTD